MAAAAAAPPLLRAMGAARVSDDVALEQILSQHPEVVRVWDDAGNTVLKTASSEGALTCVRLLLAAGAEVNAQPLDSKTALMCASAPARVEIVRELLAAGADPNAVITSTKTSALMLAADVGAAICCDHLLRHGALPNLRDSHGRTALHHAVRYGERTAPAAHPLLTHGADPTIKDADGHTALDLAIANGLEAVESDIRVRLGIGRTCTFGVTHQCGGQAFLAVRESRKREAAAQAMAIAQAEAAATGVSDAATAQGDGEDEEEDMYDDD